MKSEGALKHFILACLLALAGYAIFYTVIERRRTRKGPWEVTFTNTPSGEPAILIHQSRLGITNVQVSFHGLSAKALPDTNRLRSVAFREPRPVPFDVPFGKCLFMDTTFLPGTVTLDLFGHEIELLPRILVIDRQEQKREPGAIITLQARQPSQPAEQRGRPGNQRPV